MKLLAGAISAAATGVTVTTTISTSAGGAIPNNSEGAKPKYVRVASNGTCYVRLRAAAAVAVNTDAMVLPGSPLILAVHGNAQYAVIDDGVSVKVNITPLEDQ
jgi:hypothetical protein